MCSECALSFKLWCLYRAQYRLGSEQWFYLMHGQPIEHRSLSGYSMERTEFRLDVPLELTARDIADLEGAMSNSGPDW